MFQTLSEPTFTSFLRTSLTYLLLCSGTALFLAIVLLIAAFSRVRNLNIPPDAGFRTTLSAVPIYVVIAIDLLDLSLDFLSVPIVWIVLDRLNLRGLRDVSAIEALIPFTGPIPTLTLCWIGVRLGL